MMNTAPLLRTLRAEEVRERLIEVSQREVFAPIYVKLAQSANGPHDVDVTTVHP